MNFGTLYEHCKASGDLSLESKRSLMWVAINARHYDSASDVAKQDSTGTLVSELRKVLEGITKEESFSLGGDEPTTPAEKALKWLD